MAVQTSAKNAKFDAGRYQGLSREDLLRIYRTMYLSRRLDDREIQLKRQNKTFFQISGAGHEGVLAAAGLILRPGHDWVYPYYRDRALALALGVTPLEMFLQSVGAKDDPNSGGRQMPSHWGIPRLNILPRSSSTGMQYPHAVGMAEAALYFEKFPHALEQAQEASLGEHVRHQRDEIVYVSGGDGSTSEGEFYEGLNSACLRKLPILFLIEDNGWAISVPVKFQTPGGDIAKLVANYPGLFVEECDGSDPLKSYAVLQRAAEYCRQRKGPALVRAQVTRPYSHSLSDDEKLYKTNALREEEAHRDPIPKFGLFLVREGIVDEKELEGIEEEVNREVRESSDQALLAEPPAKESILVNQYSHDIDPTSFHYESTPQFSGEPRTMVEMVSVTLADEMARDERIVVLGEDVADCSVEDDLEHVKGKGGVFKATVGLQRRFGSERVFNTPIAEACIVGSALGMAARGLKPVAEIQFFDYIWPAMMQLRNELSVIRWRSNGAFKAPAIIRVATGGYLTGGGPYHSQSGEVLFTHTPGIRVVMPSTALDLCGLLRTAIRSDDPVLFLEHKHLYRQTYNKGEYPGKDFLIPFGRAQLRREGDHVVVITWGALVQRSLLAAHQAEKDHISVAVLDLRTIVPYDWEAIVAHVKRTNRVVIAHEDQMMCGFGSEIAARIAGELFEHLDAPVKRVGALSTPVAYCPDLEEAILPQSSDVLKAIRETARY